MGREEMLDILNGMCERMLMKGLIETLDDAKKLCDVFYRFSTNNYTNDKEYSDDILYLYNKAVLLHSKGYTSLEESYSIYNAILFADGVDFVDTGKHVQLEIVEQSPVKFKHSSISKKDDSVVDISDIVVS